MNGSRAASKILVYLVAISVPVNITIGNMNLLGGAWVFLLSVLSGLSSGM